MRVLVTGGGGFLGSHLARRLISLGHETSVFGRRHYSQLPETIRQFQGDLRNPSEVSQACKHQDAVFHVGALTGIWAPREDFISINIQGTQNILDACRGQKVARLIYTSSPSVVFGEESLEAADESVPYPSTYTCDYPETKAEAERRVLQTNGLDGLSTVVLRPHLVWGPEDPHLIPRIIQRGRKGQLVQVGDGKNRVDIIHIDNAVEGHVRALEALSNENARGRAYFLSDGKPVVLWEWINQLLREMDLPPVRRSISYQTAKNLGVIAETAFRMLGIRREPRMTRFLAGQLAKSHYFDISAACRDLNYQPVISPETAWKSTIEWFKNHPPAD